MISQQDVQIAILFQKFDRVAQGEEVVLDSGNDAQRVSTVDAFVEALRAQDPDPDHTEFDLSVAELKAGLPTLQA